MRMIEEIVGEIEATKAVLDAASRLATNSSRLAARQQSKELARLEIELREAQVGEVELSLDGLPVVDHHVEVPYLVKTLEPLQQAVRHAARHQHREAGEPDLEAPLRSLTTLSLAGTGPGSFVVRLIGPQRQTTFFGDGPFEVAVEAILGVLRAGGSEEVTSAVREAAMKVGGQAVVSLGKFTGALAISGGTTHFRWRNRVVGRDESVTVTALQAASLTSALNDVSPLETRQVIASGRLILAGVDPGRFELRTSDEPKRTLRGRVGADVIEDLGDFLGHDCRALIEVKTSTSPAGEPVDEYTLVGFSPIGPERDEIQG